MPVAALVFYAVFFLLAFVARTVVHRLRTGSTGFRGISGRPGSAEWLGGVLFVVALLLGVVAPLLDLAGVMGPIEALDREAVQAAGVGLYAGGLLTTLVSQEAMGKSWRVGVDERERTELVTTGVFAYVRNPIFTGITCVALGLAMLVPSVVAILAVGCLIVAIELQVRAVEEPYLLRLHGETYLAYASQAGRFLPGLGRSVGGRRVSGASPQ